MSNPVRATSAFLGGLTPAYRGALIFLVAGLVFSTTDAITKSLVSNVPVVHVIFGRHVSYLLAVVLIAGGTRPQRLFRTSRPWMQLARGIAMFGVTASFFLALSLLPIAEVSALNSASPLIVVVLAGPLLGEHVTRAAWLGALIGFGGVVVLVGLDTAELNPAFLVPLGSAFLFALFSILTRRLSDEPADVTVFLSGLIGLSAASVLEVAVSTPSTPTPPEWAAIGLVGLMALLGHRLLVAAYRWGRASDLAPLGYLSLVWSFASGAIVFGEAVVLRAVVGAATIAVGGVITLRGGAPTPVLSGGPVEPGVIVDLDQIEDPDDPGDAANPDDPDDAAHSARAGNPE